MKIKEYKQLTKIISASFFLGLSLSLSAQTANEIKVFQSVKGKSDMMEKLNPIKLVTDDKTEMEAINVYPKIQYQLILGFGGAFTETSAYNYMQLSGPQRDKLIESYFDKEKGIGLNFCRTHINSADFSISEYNYVKDNDAQLKTFSIDRDRKYIIPMLKAAKKYAPNLYLFASPWTPPAWMKSNNKLINGGKLLPKYYDTWAKYFVKYLEAYKNEGLNFFGVTVQNEPKAIQTWESCQYTGTDEGNFATKYLKPELKKAGFDNIKIMVWDHNKERVFERASESLSVPGATNAIWGIACHWYSGDHFDALRLTHEKFPYKPIILTEFCTGIEKKGPNFAASNWDDVESYSNEIIGDLNNYVSAIVDWNLVVDLNGGPYHNRTGGCKAQIVVDAAKNSFSLQPLYYAFGHFSKFIERGAKRIGCSSYIDNLKVSSFINPNGEVIVEILNKGDKAASPKLRINGSSAALNIPAKSLTTLVVPTK